MLNLKQVLLLVLWKKFKKKRRLDRLLVRGFDEFAEPLHLAKKEEIFQHIRQHIKRWGSFKSAKDIKDFYKKITLIMQTIERDGRATDVKRRRYVWEKKKDY